MSSGYECVACGESFDSKRGRGAHQANCGPFPWEDEDRLREMYIDEMMSTPEIGRELGCSDGTIRNRLEEFGIERRPSGKIPKEELIADLSRLGEKYGRVPTTMMVTAHGKHSDMSYYTQFDSFSDALIEAGYEPNVRYDITDEELLDDLRRLKRELSRIPYQKDITRYGEFGTGIYYTRFGGICAALKSAGLVPRMHFNVSDEELLDDLSRLADIHGDTLTTGIIRADGKYIITNYADRFGSIPAAIEKAGFETYTQPYGPDSPRWRGGKTITNAVRRTLGPESWTSIARRERSDCCEMCDESEGLLDVHHLIPVRAGGLNESWCLMTLCRPCHVRAERFLDQFIPFGLVDWSDEELPSGRLPSEDYMNHVIADSEPLSS